MTFLTTLQRRAHWEAVEAGRWKGWVCDRCGDTNEEGLVLWQTGRETRSVAAGGEVKVVCLCFVCEEKTPHGPFVDQ